MSAITDQIIEEYKKEALEKVEDEKNKILFNQGIVFLKSLCRFVNYIVYILMAVFISSITLLIVFLDTTTLEAIKSASNLEIITVKNEVLKGLAFFFMFLSMVYYVINSKRFGNFSIRERINNDIHDEMLLIEKIARISEEVIRRNNLIEESK